MNATDNFDAELRAMLRARAEDIQALPPGILSVLSTGESDPRGEHAGTASSRRVTPRRRSLLIAAAVAAVLAVSAGIATVAVDGGSADRRSPVGTAPTPSASHSTSSTRSGRPVLPPSPGATCSTTLPPAWNAKLEDPGSAGAPRDTALATSSDGSVLYYRDLGTSREVRLRKPDGTSTRLLSLPDSENLAPALGAISGHDAVIGQIYAPRGGNGTGDALFRIGVVDLSSGHLWFGLDVMTTSDYADAGRTTEGMAVANGRIYWDERSEYPAKAGVVRFVDIASKDRGVAYSGPAVTVHGSAGGVYWIPRNKPDAAATRITIPAKGLPAAVLTATTPVMRVSLATDGTRYAWIDAGRSSIGWYDGRTVTYRRVGAAVAKERPGSNALAVAGQYVSYHYPATSRSLLLDVRTGAQATLPDPVFLTGGGATYLTGFYSDGKSASQLLQVDTSTLPDLQC